MGSLAPPALLRRRLPLRHTILICSADSDLNARLLERAASPPLRAGGAIEHHRLRGISDWTSRLMSARIQGVSAWEARNSDTAMKCTTSQNVSVRGVGHDA